MKRLMQIALEDGEDVLIEVDAGAVGGQTTRGVNPTEMIVRTSQTFEASIAAVKPIAAAVAKQLMQIGEEVESIRIRFGMKFSAEAGAFIASAAAEANFDIEVSWRNRRTAT